MLKKFPVKFKFDVIALFLLSLTAPLFFYKLGQSSLVSWDEAWYAEIARNILQSGDIFNLFYNGDPYYDHPPLGFWMIAITFKIFGISEFWARFAPAVVGMSGIFVMYFLGRELFNRAVGFAAALALSSSFWFLYRSRSGNLDSILTVLFILTLLLAVKAVKDRRFAIPFAASLAGLFLTKTLVPLTILPALAIIFWQGKNLNLKNLWPAGLVFLSLVGSWFVVSYISQSNFLERYLMIGFPGASAEASYLDNLKLFKEYLHSGIGRWFWPGVAGILLGLVLHQRRFFVLALFAFAFAFPFIFSSKGQIWHLIPLHPILILSFFGTAFVVLEKIVRRRKLAAFLIIAGGLYLSLTQIRQIWYQFIDIPAYVSDEAILSYEAGKFPYKFYIDGGDFTPAAVFYSGKDVEKVWEDGLTSLFETEPSFVLITSKWRLDKFNIKEDQYSIIKSDRDKILVVKEDE